MRIPWDDHEIALLFDMYEQVSAGRNIHDAAAALSKILRQKAVCEGKTVDEKFRNYNGMMFYLRRVEYLFSGGRSGMPDQQRSVLAMWDVYQNDQPRYQEILKEAKALIDSEKSPFAEAFFAYASKGTSMTKEQILSNLEKAGKYCKLHCPILGIRDLHELRKIQQTVYEGKSIRFHLGHDAKFVQETVRIYHNFVKQYRGDRGNYISQPKVNADVGERAEESVTKDAPPIVLNETIPNTPAKISAAKLEEPIAATVSLFKPPTSKEMKAWIVSPSEQSIAALFSIEDPERYDSIKVLDQGYCVRAQHCFLAHNISSVSDVLRLSVLDFFSFSNIGKGTILDIIQVTSDTIQQSGYPVKTGKPVIECASPVFERTDWDFVNNILYGNSQNASEQIDHKKLEVLEKAREIIGDEMLKAILRSPALIDSTISMLHSYVSKYDEEKYIESTLQGFINKLPNERKSRKVALFWRVYISRRNVRDILKDVPSELVFENLPSYIIAMQHHDKEDLEVVCDFLSWSAFDTIAQRDRLFTRVFTNRDGSSNDRNIDILRRRIKGETLADIGNDLSLTRERVRQISVKQEKLLARFWINDGYDLLDLVHLERGGDVVIQQEEAAEVIGMDQAALIWFAIRDNELHGKNWNYNKNTRSVVFDTEDYSKLIQQIIDNLPDMIERSKLRDLIEDVASEQHIPFELLWLEVSRQYDVTGIFAHSMKLTRRAKAAYILNHFFPDGMKVGGDGQYEEYKQLLQTLFGDEQDSSQDHSIDAVIGDVGVLVGRGLYMGPERVQWDPAVISIVETFVESSPRTVIPFADLYASLQEELEQCGIYNRYMLQGALNYFGTQYVTGRDYLTKETNANLASEMDEYIRTRDRIVTKDMIREAFPSQHDASISQVVARCSDIVMMPNGCYMHASHLKYTDDEAQHIGDVLTHECKNGPRSTRVLITVMKEQFSEFMTNNQIDDYATLYSILSWILKDRLYFLNWYFIAAEPLDGIGNTSDILLYWVQNRNLLTYSDLQTVVNHIGFNYNYSILELVRVLSPVFVRVSPTTLQRTETIGLNEESISAAVQFIRNLLTERHWISARIPIDMSTLPVISLPWTAELLESVIYLSNQIPFIRISTSDNAQPYSIWVEDRFKDQTYEQFVIDRLIERQQVSPFETASEVQRYLFTSGFAGVKLPDFVEKRHMIRTPQGFIQIVTEEVDRSELPTCPAEAADEELREAKSELVSVPAVQAVIVSQEKVAHYNDVLRESFEDGLRLLGMRLRKFRALYTEKWGDELPADDETLIAELKQVGSFRDDRIFVKQDTAQGGIVQILWSEIRDALESGASCVCAESLLHRHEAEIAAQLSVYHVDDLLTVLIEQTPEGYTHKYDMFVKAWHLPDPDRDVLRMLSKSAVPMNYQQMQEALWYIPLDRIKHALVTDPSMVNVDKETYFYAPNIPVTTEEMATIRRSMRQEIEQNGYMVAKQLVELIRQKCPSAAINLADFKDWGLRNIFGYVLREEFTFSGTIISEKGRKIEMWDLYGSFCREREEMQLAELKAFSADIGSPIYWDTVLREMVRINATTFMRRDRITFNTEEADKAIEDMCPGDMLPVQDIQLYLHFPPIEVPWNIYVLESYLHRGSKLFRIEQASVSQDKVYGIVVRNRSTITSYKDAVIQLLAHNHDWQDEASGMEIVIARGCQATRLWSNFSEVAKSAALLREKLDDAKK